MTHRPLSPLIFPGYPDAKPRGDRTMTSSPIGALRSSIPASSFCGSMENLAAQKL